MGAAKYRVRFAPVKWHKNDPLPDNTSATFKTTDITQIRSNGYRSRKGCISCKRRRVKCDETFPACLRCQKRGEPCMMDFQNFQWQAEMPWPKLQVPSIGLPLVNSIHVNKHLLEYWFDRASHIMVLDPQKNPLAHSVIEYLSQTPALLHVLQSISAAHEHYFQPERLLICLEERGKALTTFHRDLLQGKTALQFNFLTIIILGLSAPWVDDSRSEFGREHLLAARSMITDVLSENEVTPLIHYIVGKYVYWDMACSFLVDSSEQLPVENTSVDSFILQTKDMFHPTMGYSIDSFYLLASIGRYFRRIVDTGERDFPMEAILEERLLEGVAVSQKDEEIHWLSDGFRKIGLITLYRIKKRYPLGFVEDDDTEELILDYVRLTIDELSCTPITSSYLNLQSLQLLMAGAELTADDEDFRNEVRLRFKALFSLNRLRINIWVLELLEELWVLADNGENITWLELMLSKGWRLMLG